MVTALTSLLTGRPVRHTVGMTGEVTLQGRVLPIGGVKQKVLAAHAAGLTDVVLPERNRGDLDDVPAGGARGDEVPLRDDDRRGAGGRARARADRHRGLSADEPEPRQAHSAEPEGEAVSSDRRAQQTATQYSGVAGAADDEAVVAPSRSSRRRSRAPGR